jgi:hypothetical protein
LHIGDILYKLEIKDILPALLSEGGQEIRVSSLCSIIPGVPGLISELFFQCHIKRIVIQPAFLFSDKGVQLPVGEKLPATKGFPQHGLFVFINFVIVNIIGIAAPIEMAILFMLEEPQGRKLLGIDKVGIQRESEGDGKGIAVACRTKRKDLPYFGFAAAKKSAKA